MREQGAGITAYKKFNPNPRREPEIPDIESFPEYDTWKSMTEAGTLPSEFDVTPDYDIPKPGATTPGGFEFGTPERIERYKEFYELPGVEPTGEPTETGIPQISPEEIMDMINSGSLSTAEINLMRDLGLVGGLQETPEEPVVEGGEPISFLSLVPEEARQKYEAGELTDEDWKSWVSYQKDISNLEKIASEKAKVPEEEMLKGIADTYTKYMAEGRSKEKIYADTLVFLKEEYSIDEEDANELINKALNKYFTE